MRSLCVLAFCVFLAGCGGGDRKYSVSGTVKLKDGTPIETGSIELTNSDNTFYGTIEDGDFEIAEGAMKGTYKVVVLGTGGDLSGHDGGGVPGDLTEKVHQKYLNHSTTDLEIEVDGSTSKDFELEPPAK